MAAVGVPERTRREESRELVNRPRLEAEMARWELDALVACSPVNVLYLSRAVLDDQRERLWDAMVQCVVWPRAGEPVLVVSRSAEGQARRSSWFAEVRAYDWPQQTPVPLLAEALAERGLADGRVGVELSAFPALLLDDLRRALPRGQVVDCAAVLERTRAMKTPGEVELLARVARMTERAIEAGFMAARTGDRERDVAERIIGNLLHEGVDDVSTAWLGVGANAATRRRRPSDDPLVRGETVRVDFGGWLDGMASDITRMAVVGPPSARQRDIYARLRDVQLRIFDAMRAGARCADVYRLYERAVKEHGLPFAGGILTHGIGARVHEYPIVVSDRTDALLEAGMVMAVEPSVTLPGEAKYTLEDLVIVTDDGAVRLSDYTDTSELFVIDA